MECFKANQLKINLGLGRQNQVKNAGLLPRSAILPVVVTRPRSASAGDSANWETLYR